MKKNYGNVFVFVLITLLTTLFFRASAFAEPPTSSYVGDFGTITPDICLKYDDSYVDATDAVSNACNNVAHWCNVSTSSVAISSAPGGTMYDVKKWDCSAAKKAKADLEKYLKSQKDGSTGGPTGDHSGSSTGDTSTSGGEGTKNPDRAEGTLSGDGIGSDPVGDFLGFPAWNRDVYFKPGRQIGPQIMKIVLNITEILLRLAGIAAVIVIIYAGAMFIIGSYSASPDGIAKAKTILINGVIGLIIAIAATAIITFIVGSLKGK